MKSRAFVKTISAAVLCLAILSSQLTATTIVPMSVERLARASTNVVLGEAGDAWTEWNPEHTLIYTVTRFHVARSIKGESDTTIFVKQMGGVSGAYQQKVAGVRQWREGEESVLFIHPSESNDGRYVVTGLMQGNFSVKSQGVDPVVSNGIDGVEAFDPQTKTVQIYRGSAMRLSQLVNRVKRSAL